MSDEGTRAHRAGLSAPPWQLRAEHGFLPRPLRGPGAKSARGDYGTHWGRPLDAGVDGVFVDHPALAVRPVGERAAAPRR
ncbi:hypothetical protein [Clavibacter michiganensis]|uniref:hypothetical protein n=1 Tax=Clavibacter michiganensis TaxID=28447 RepID=UPI00292E8B20|nr:hypothetical protein [Clavibacter michiganensis]